MPTDGEIPPRLGEEFRVRVCTLVKYLGYVERLNRKFGIDFGADCPPKKKNLIRPLFSPSGRTAFDFKSGMRVSLVSEANKLKAKIDSLNASSNPEFSNISGGVIVTDSKVGNTDISRALDAGVHCWDIRYAHFIAKKVDVFKTLVRLSKNPKERQLDEWTTFFTSFGSYTGFIELTSHLFYHNPLEEMNSAKIDALLQKFASSVRPVLISLNLPVIIHLKLHSIAEVTEGAEDKFKELTSHEINKQIRYEPQACFLVSYSLAPWFIYCRENM